MTSNPNFAEITNELRRAFQDKPEFRPCALFDDGLDCIRVLARDTSVTEIRIDNRITVLEDNRPLYRRQYVGFTIKGAKHFCQSQGLDLETPVQVTDILDRILAASPDPIVGIAVNLIAKPLVADTKLDRIDLSHHSLVKGQAPLPA